MHPQFMMLWMLLLLPILLLTITVLVMPLPRWSKSCAVWILIKWWRWKLFAIVHLGDCPDSVHQIWNQPIRCATRWPSSHFPSWWCELDFTGAQMQEAGSNMFTYTHKKKKTRTHTHTPHQTLTWERIPKTDSQRLTLLHAAHEEGLPLGDADNL